MSYLVKLDVVATDSKTEPSINVNQRLVRDKNNEVMDFNRSVKGKYIWIIYTLSDKDDFGVSAIKFITSDKKMKEGPDGWTFLKQDLNEGAKGKYIYLCYKTNNNTKYISKLEAGIGKASSGALNNMGDMDVVLLPDLNKGAGGKYIYLGYKYL